MDLDIEVVGIASLEQDMRQMYNSLNRKDMLKLMRAPTNKLVNALKTEAPVRKGYLRQAIKVAAARGRNDAPNATLLTGFKKTYPFKGKMVKPYYAWFVHNGTVNSGGTRKHRAGASVGTQRIKPNPFVSRAYEATIDDVGKNIIDQIVRKMTE